jgi:hypothetical protein
MIKRAFQAWMRTKLGWFLPKTLTVFERQLSEAYRAGFKAGRKQGERHAQ